MNKKVLKFKNTKSEYLRYTLLYVLIYSANTIVIHNLCRCVLLRDFSDL